jgi:hypothetical protein
MVVASIPGVAGDVFVMQEGNRYRMSNGELTVTIGKSSERVTGVKSGGPNLWERGRERFVSNDPATNGGEREEVVCRFLGTGEDLVPPGKSEIHYSIDRPEHHAVCHRGARARGGRCPVPHRRGALRHQAGRRDFRPAHRGQGPELEHAHPCGPGCGLSVFCGSRWHQGVLHDCLRMETVLSRDLGLMKGTPGGSGGISTFMGGIQ